MRAECRGEWRRAWAGGGARALPREASGDRQPLQPHRPGEKTPHPDVGAAVWPSPPRARVMQSPSISRTANSPMTQSPGSGDRQSPESEPEAERDGGERRFGRAPPSQALHSAGPVLQHPSFTQQTLFTPPQTGSRQGYSHAKGPNMALRAWVGVGGGRDLASWGGAT